MGEKLSDEAHLSLSAASRENCALKRATSFAIKQVWTGPLAVLPRPVLVAKVEGASLNGLDENSELQTWSGSLDDLFGRTLRTRFSKPDVVFNDTSAKASGLRS